MKNIDYHDDVSVILASIKDAMEAVQGGDSRSTLEYLFEIGNKIMDLEKKVEHLEKISERREHLYRWEMEKRIELVKKLENIREILEES